MTAEQDLVISTTSEEESGKEVLFDYQTFLATMEVLEIVDFPKLPLEEQGKLKYGYTELSRQQVVRSDCLERDIEFPRIWYKVWEKPSKERFEERLNPVWGITENGLVLRVSFHEGIPFSPKELLTPWGKLDGFVRAQATVEQWVAAMPHILKLLAAERLEITDTDALYAIRRVGEISLPQPTVLELDKFRLAGAPERGGAWSQLVEIFAEGKKREFDDIYFGVEK